MIPSNVTEAVNSGWISSKGEFIEAFEENFARYCGVKYGVATSNGTVALHLALNALEVRMSDEIIVPTLAFIAVANAVTYCNAKPVFVDSHSEYWCIDPDKIEEKITPKTKAIVPVHLYGHPCDMNAVMEIAEDHNLYVIEDAAEAHGAEYKGKKVGGLGDISIFSFYGNKIITTGEGGMCLTNNEELYEKMRILRDHGMNPNKRYWHDVIGFNYRMTNPEMSWAMNVYWMYSILIEDDFYITRDQLMGKLEENEIETRPFFYPIHIMPPYKRDKEFPVAERTSKRGINLPSAVTLKEEDITKIVEIIATGGEK
jgi:perosamine synthetase